MDRKTLSVTCDYWPITAVLPRKELASISLRTSGLETDTVIWGYLFFSDGVSRSQMQSNLVVLGMQ